MPEAKTLPTLRTLINVGRLEEVYVDQEELDEWRADQDIRDAEEAERLAELNEDGVVVEISKPKKRVAKKRTVKKTSVRKTVKKGKRTNGLEEQAV
jgi:hypothetical protein